MSHHCHVPRCDVPTSPDKLMCYGHWAEVPTNLRRDVYHAYRQGQEGDKKPSREWLAAAQAAIASIY